MALHNAIMLITLRIGMLGAVIKDVVLSVAGLCSIISSRSMLHQPKQCHSATTHGSLNKNAVSVGCHVFQRCEFQLQTERYQIHVVAYCLPDSCGIFAFLRAQSVPEISRGSNFGGTSSCAFSSFIADI